MSIVLGNVAYPLPVQANDVLVVNQGTVPIYLGTMRDNLGTQGMSLQPLASVIISGGLQYYAIAPTAPNQGCPIDFIEGGSAFAPSPQQVVSVLNSQTLANQIGAAVPVPPSAAAIGAAVPVPPSASDIAGNISNTGTKLIDTSANVQGMSTWSLGQTSNIIDCRGFLTFNLNLFFITSPTGSGTVTLTLRWMDTSNPATNVAYWMTSYEINMQGVYIIDRCLGNYLEVTWDYSNGVTGGAITGNVLLSNRVVDRPRVVDLSTGQSGGLLGAFNGTLSANASTSKIYCGLGLGPAVLTITSAAGGQNLRTNLAWGNKPWYNSGGPIPGFRIDTAANATSIQQLILPCSPLALTVSNLSATAATGWSATLIASGD